MLYIQSFFLKNGLPFRSLIGSVFVLLIAHLVSCTEPLVGSRSRPFTMYFVPAIDASKIALTAHKVEQYVSSYVTRALENTEEYKNKSDKTFYVKSSIPASYIAIVEAFGTGRADFAVFNTFGYILAKDIKKYPVEAVLTIEREGGARFYYSQIIVRADSGIKKLSDLQGKKFAFSDVASTSGYIVPRDMLNKAKVKLSEYVFAKKHDNVVTMVYKKQVDAGATYYDVPKEVMIHGQKKKIIKDARSRVMTQFPDVEEKVKIIALSEGIPNEPWMMRTNIYKDPAKNKRIKKLIIEALLSFQKSSEGKKALKDLYYLKRLVPVTDSNYDSIRKMILSSGLDLEKTIKQKSKKLKKSSVKK